MKTLPSSLSNAVIHRNFDRNTSGFDGFPLNKPRICFFQLEKIVKARYLHLISVQQKASVAVRSSSPVPNSQVDTAETQLPNAYQSKTVHVKFQLQKECSFGEHFFMVGDDPMFGLWDPNNAVPLNWSDGHIWFVELDIPVGKSINFKFILKGITRNLLWQPGPDRTFQTFETENTITVSEDWENADHQKIIEETPSSKQDEEMRADQGTEIVAENLTPATANKETAYDTNQVADVDHNLHQEKMPLQAKSYNVDANDNSPLLEKPKTMVADNLIFLTEDSLANQNEVLGEQRPSNTNDVSVAMSNQSMLVADTILESTDRASTIEDQTTREADGSLITHEEDPVLVPGLAPSSILSTGVTTQEEDVKTTNIDAPSRVSEAKTHNLPELDEKLDSDDDRVQEKIAEMSSGSSKRFIGEVNQMCHQARGEKQDLEPLKSHLSQDEMQEVNDSPFHGKTAETSSDGNKQLDSEVTHKPLEAIEEEDSEPFQSNPMENDIQWGRRTLQKFLNSLGIL